MSITVNLYYTGTNCSARKFAEEMEASGTADAIRAEEGNLRYEYFFPMNDPETVLLIDSWRDQAAINAHHASPMMGTIAALREKYDLHMKVERFVSDDGPADESFIRKRTDETDETNLG
jgi:quinol monooxygenase YgiN